MHVITIIAMTSIPLLPENRDSQCEFDQGSDSVFPKKETMLDVPTKKRQVNVSHPRELVKIPTVEIS